MEFVYKPTWAGCFTLHLHPLKPDLSSQYGRIPVGFVFKYRTLHLCNSNNRNVVRRNHLRWAGRAQPHPAHRAPRGCRRLPLSSPPLPAGLRRCPRRSPRVPAPLRSHREGGGPGGRLRGDARPRHPPAAAAPRSRPAGPPPPPAPARAPGGTGRGNGKTGYHRPCVTCTAHGRHGTELT